MSIDRRNILRTSSLVIAAPAIVKAENLMKMIVPKKQEIIIGTVALKRAFDHFSDNPYLSNVDFVKLLKKVHNIDKLSNVVVDPDVECHYCNGSYIYVRRLEAHVH